MSRTDQSSSPVSVPRLAYSTLSGSMFCGRIEDLLEHGELERWQGKVQLIFTSPPFPLNRKKKYGNLTGQDYVDWLAGLAPAFADLLTPDGSIVMEVGNSWERGKPTMSLLATKALIEFLENGNLNLCQQFITHNPAKLPGPAAWVTVERIRVKDSFAHVWWMAKTDRPKADNRKVLTPYSESMKRLLARQAYNAGKRPSGHKVNSTTFNRDNGGAIPSNVLSLPNTRSRDPYQDYCREHEITPHPARMHPGLAEFFINFLTDAGDLVLDPFAGSNLTGSVAEQLGRQWLAAEPVQEYVDGSIGRIQGVGDQ